MNINFKTLIRKKGIRFKKAKKSGMDEDRARYLNMEQMVKRELLDAERVYVNGILQNGLESGNNKPFWKYVKSQKQETVGISALKSNGNMITDSLSKAKILNSQFKSVLTPQSGNPFPQLPGTQFTKIKPLHISENGVFMLLDRIDVSKSSGPDKLPGRLLQSIAKEITPVVHFIITQSLCTGELPTEWTQANVAPILKKDSKLQSVNYRPVSLTCITCKLFEHIICKHILAHLEDHKILTDLQHGFRSGRSCKTQLVTTFQDLAQMHIKKGSQIDIAVLDFSKSFDMVPHDGLLSKLKHYGIDEKIWLWIYNLKKNRKQSVVVDGKQSSLIDVVSGVPQGTVLGTLLFLLHINDLPSIVSFEVRLFADDCLIYRNI